MATLNEMNNTTIARATPSDTAELDELLWRVLWQPLGLPRDVRGAFSIDGEEIDLVAMRDGRIVGGLVAVWTGDAEVELHHLAVAPGAQKTGIGRGLVAELVRIVVARGGGRIHAIVRNRSAGFFRQLGFTPAPGEAPEHAAFARHGITFELVEKIV